MNAYSDARWVGLKFTFEFVGQEAREDAVPSASSGDEASQLSQVIDDNRSLALAFCGLEQNRWGLGHPFSPLPDDITTAQTGWIYSAMSRSDGTFASNPYLEFNFSETHSSIGFTLRFEESTGAHATRFLVRTFDRNGNVISSKQVENHSAIAAVSLLSPDYVRVRFDFQEISRPYAKLRIGEVLFGIVESFDPNTISETSLEYEIDPIAESLPSRECVVRIDNSDQRFNLINPQGVYAYLQQPQSFHVQMGIGETKADIDYVSMGEFYFATASAEDSSLTAEITAYDWFYWLEKGTYKNTSSGEWTLGEAVAAILENAEIECEVVMSEEAAETPLLKITDDVTNREALRLAVQAACCTAFFDRAGRLVILDLTQASPVDELNSDNMTEPPKVTIESAVNTVQLSVHNAAQGTETVYTASHIVRNEMRQVKTVQNNMVHPDMGQTVADWILAWCQGRITYETDERGNPETDLTETVKICDYFGVNRNAIVTKQVYKYDGGLSAESEAIARDTT